MIFNIHIYVHFDHSWTNGHKNMQMLKTITLDTCINIEIQFQRNFSIRIFFLLFQILCFPSHSLQYILETRASGVYLIDHSPAGIFMAGSILLLYGALYDYTSFCTHIIYIHNTIALDDMSTDSHSFLINKDNDKCEILYENTIKCIIIQDHTLY